MTHLQRWERRSELPLAVVAGVFLAGYAWPILEPGLDHSVKRGCEYVVYAAWAMFAVDYLVRVCLADHRWHFVTRHVLDLAAVALPVLRPLRLLRLVALIRVLNRKATYSLHGRVATYVGCSAALVIFLAALAVLDAERGRPDSNIETFPDALWWSATTVTTVGYGDRFPVTRDGRLVAIGLMLAGIALIGTVTAAIASWLVARVRDVESDAEANLAEQLTGLRQEIADLKTLLVPGTTGTTHSNRAVDPGQLRP
jgi:voltage-gated potassium channel